MKKIFDTKNVLKFLEDADGKKYNPKALAGIFKVGIPETRAMLEDLLETKQVELYSSHGRYFFIPSKTLVVSRSISLIQRPFRPLVLPKGMGERCRELYPDGHSFGNLTGGKS